MPYVHGFLRLGRRTGIHPDNSLPGYGHPDQGLPGYGHPDQGLPGYGHPDQGLPGDQPYPDQGLPGMEYPDQGLPMPPPGVWPPPSASHPIVPAPPGTPPGTIWPPIGRPPSWGGGWGSGPRPDQGLPGAQPGPDQGLPGSQPSVDNTLPGAPQTYWCVVGIPGVGWRYAAIDPSIQPKPPIATTPEPKG